MRSVIDVRGFTASMLSVIAVMIISGIVTPHISIKVLEAKGLLWVSLLTLAFMVARATASIIQAGLYRSLPTRYLGSAGLLLIITSYVLYAFLPETAYPAIKLLEGFAAGVFWPLMQTLIVDSVHPGWRSRWMSIYFMAGSLAMYVGYQLGSLILVVMGKEQIMWVGITAGIAYTAAFAVVAPGKTPVFKAGKGSSVVAALRDARKVAPFIPIIVLVGGVNGLMKDYLFAYTKQVTMMSEAQIRNYWSFIGYAGLALSYVLAHVQEGMGKTRLVLALSTALVASASLMPIARDPVTVFAILTATTVGLRVIRPILRGVVANAASRPENGIALVNAFSNIAAGTAPVIVACLAMLV